jgi:hypothetical protein
VCHLWCLLEQILLSLNFSLLISTKVFIEITFCSLMKPPASFLQAMEEYVREAPRGSTFLKDQVWNCYLLNFIRFGWKKLIRNDSVCALSYENRTAKEHQVSLTISSYNNLSKPSFWLQQQKNCKSLDSCH